MIGRGAKKGIMRKKEEKGREGNRRANLYRLYNIQFTPPPPPIFSLLTAAASVPVITFTALFDRNRPSRKFWNSIPK